MFKKTGLCLLVFCVVMFGLWGCGSKPYACILVEGNEDSVRVNQPVTLNAFCSSSAKEYNWQINLDSVYFTPRITLTFSQAGEQEIYLLVSNGSKSSSIIKKLVVRP